MGVMGVFRQHEPKVDLEAPPATGIQIPAATHSSSSLSTFGTFISNDEFAEKPTSLPTQDFVSKKNSFFLLNRYPENKVKNVLVSILGMILVVAVLVVLAFALDVLVAQARPSKVALYSGGRYNW